MHPILRSALDEFNVEDGHPDALLRYLDSAEATPHTFALCNYSVPFALQQGYRAGYSDRQCYELWRTYRRAIATRLRTCSRIDG